MHQVLVIFGDGGCNVDSGISASGSGESVDSDGIGASGSGLLMVVKV